MIRVGIAGMGMMGLAHLEAYAKRADVGVVAIADRDPARLGGAERAGSNIGGVAAGAADLGAATRYDDAAGLIADPNVDLVDICLPTPAHAAATRAVIAAGKHLLVEKPLARSAAEAHQLADLAEAAPTISMPAMCMRFWPGWTWLERAVKNATYGRTRAVHFQRLGAMLAGDGYRDGAASGGAMLDLHIHDTDFVQFLFGRPRSVTSHGYSALSGEIDHVVTRYDCVGADLVVAEGGWVEASSFAFTMRYIAHFERATAVFDLGADAPLTVYTPGRDPESVALEPELGYDREIEYLIDCIERGRRPEIVTMRHAADAVRIIEAEIESVRTGATVPVH